MPIRVNEVLNEIHAKMYEKILISCDDKQIRVFNGLFTNEHMSKVWVSNFNIFQVVAVSHQMALISVKILNLFKIQYQYVLTNLPFLSMILF